MSDTEVRPMGNKFVVITNLIVRYSTTDILNQARKFVCICGVVEKTPDFPLLLQRLKFSQNLSKFSGGTCLSDSMFNLESVILPS